MLRTFINAGIVAFYTLIVIVGVILLAAVQLRASTGSAFDTWRLTYNSTQALADRHLALLAKLRGDAAADQQSILFAQSCERYFGADGSLLAQVDPAEFKRVAAYRAAGKSIDKLADDFEKCFYRDMNGWRYEESKLLSQLVPNKAAQDDALQLIATDKTTREELVRDRQEFLGLKQMDGSPVTRIFVDTPYDLLVMVLVIMMGALGGMVRLLRDYGDPSQNNPQPRDYLIVPLIGAVVGIGGYVLAKTGLLLLSSTREETSVSPFMIGLVGIISGLLAREMIDAIAEAGRKMLKPGDAGATLTLTATATATQPPQHPSAEA
jgi:hypothetical protein